MVAATCQAWFSPPKISLTLVSSKTADSASPIIGALESTSSCGNSVIEGLGKVLVSPTRLHGELRKLGLDLERPTGLVGFGGHGSSQMLKVAKSLEDVQLILLCGHNEVLARRLSAQKVKARHVVIGFTPDIERYMAISDFFIGKPGPGSLSEAVHMRLPVITFKNAWTMPQERYNTTWVKENNLGIVVSSLRDVQRATTELLANLPTFHEATEKVRNRAVFEVVDILAQELSVQTFA